MKWKSNGNIKIVNYITMNRWTTHMKDHIARYYATAYAWYAYDTALMSKIGQPENLLYTHSRISFNLFALFANRYRNIGILTNKFKQIMV